MTDGMDGYFVDVDYPAQLVAHVTPAHIAAVAAWQGIRAPDLAKPFRFLDIGCGSGAALALAAASHPTGRFEGIDGLESHIRTGRALSEGISNFRLTHALFAEALADARSDCDIAVMHGVLSWAGPAARRDAMDLAAARLKPGGLLVASYNALPGSARKLTFQHLIRRFVAEFDGPPDARYREAFARVRAMADAGFAALDSRTVGRLAELSEVAPPEYFLHEYMHDNWQPFWPRQIEAAFARRGLRRVGTADWLRMRPDLCLDFTQARFAETLDPAHLDMMVDMALDSMFRIDLFAHQPDTGEPDVLCNCVWLGSEVGTGTDMAVEVPNGEVAFDRCVGRDIVEKLGKGPMPLPALLESMGGGHDIVISAIEALLIADRILALGPPTSQTGEAALLNARLADVAARERPPIDGFAGVCGPVAVDEAQMAVAGLEADMVLDRAHRDASFRNRVLATGLDPSAEATRRAVEISLARSEARLTRLGVVRPDRGH